MQIIGNYEIVSSVFIVELTDDKITSETLTKLIQEINGDVTKMIDTINGIVVVLSKKYYDEIITGDEACAKIKDLYGQLEFGTIIDYTYFEKVIELYFSRDKYLNKTFEERIAVIKEIFDINKNCTVQEIQIAVNVLCLRIMLSGGIVTIDLDFMREIVSVIKTYTTEELEGAQFPAILITEF